MKVFTDEELTKLGAEDLVDYLRGIADGSIIPDRHRALCSNAGVAGVLPHEGFVEAFHDIPYCGDDYMWPLGIADSSCNLEKLYCTRVRGSTDFWYGEYGERRRQLADDVADWFEEEYLQEKESAST